MHVGGERLDRAPPRATARSTRSTRRCAWPSPRAYPELDDIELADYKVRILDEKKGTAAVTRVLIERSDGETSWGTIGVSENIIEATWEALVDSIEYGLLRGERADA